MTIARNIRSAGTLVSPRHRRWQRLLKSLDLDPDTLPRPVAELGPRDFIVCGSPRSGTSLAAAALHQPPASVTVMEPWDGMRIPPATLFASLREEIVQTGALSRGRLDTESLDRGEVRWIREGARRIAVETVKNHLLGVKWPAFWRYLELFHTTRFVVCVRHPLEVIGSYRATGGRLAEGLEYDIPFNGRMNGFLNTATDDEAFRRVLLYDYINERILPHVERPNVYVLRYERWFTERRRLLAELSAFLDEDVTGSGIRIRRPGRRQPSDQESDLIRTLCRTAEPLGYEI
jgi:hypothetical protein